MLHEVKVFVSRQLLEIGLSARLQIVDTYDLVPPFDQAVTQMRSQKSCPARYDYSFHLKCSFLSGVCKVCAPAPLRGPGLKQGLEFGRAVHGGMVSENMTSCRLGDLVPAFGRKFFQNIQDIAAAIGDQ